MATRTTTKKAEPKTTTAKTAIEKEAPCKARCRTGDKRAGQSNSNRENN